MQFRNAEELNYGENHISITARLATWLGEGLESRIAILSLVVASVAMLHLKTCGLARRYDALMFYCLNSGHVSGCRAPTWFMKTFLAVDGL